MLTRVIPYIGTGTFQPRKLPTIMLPSKGRYKEGNGVITLSPLKRKKMRK